MAGSFVNGVVPLASKRLWVRRDGAAQITRPRWWRGRLACLELACLELACSEVASSELACLELASSKRRR